MPKPWPVRRGTKWAYIADGEGRWIAEQVPLDIADRMASVPVLEAELQAALQVCEAAREAAEEGLHPTDIGAKTRPWQIRERLRNALRNLDAVRGGGEG